MDSILYIENNADDIALVKLVFRRYCPNILVYAIKNINSAKELLLTGPHSACSLILLDYRLDDGEKGSDFLKWLRSHPFLNAIPVVMYNGDEPGTMVKECYEARTNHFIHKPACLDQLKQFATCMNKNLTSDPICLEVLRSLPIHNSHTQPDVSTVPPGKNVSQRSASTDVLKTYRSEI